STPVSACGSTSRRARSRTCRAAIGCPSGTSPRSWSSVCAGCWDADPAFGGQGRLHRGVDLREHAPLVAGSVARKGEDAEREGIPSARELLDAAALVADERHGPRHLLGRIRPLGVVTIEERERDRAAQVLA